MLILTQGWLLVGIWIGSSLLFNLCHGATLYPSACVSLFCLTPFCILYLLLEIYLLAMPMILQLSCRVWIKSQFSSSHVDFCNPIWSSCLLLRRHTDVIYNQISGGYGRLSRFNFWPNRREALKMGLREDENIRCLKGSVKLKSLNDTMMVFVAAAAVLALPV